MDCIFGFLAPRSLGGTPTSRRSRRSSLGWRPRCSATTSLRFGSRQPSAPRSRSFSRPCSPAAPGRPAPGAARAALVRIAGHVLLTVSIDLPLTAAVILFAVRAILRRDSRGWLAAGAGGGGAAVDGG